MVRDFRGDQMLAFQFLCLRDNKRCCSIPPVEYDSVQIHLYIPHQVSPPLPRLAGSTLSLPAPTPNVLTFDTLMYWRKSQQCEINVWLTDNLSSLIKLVDLQWALILFRNSVNKNLITRIIAHAPFTSWQLYNYDVTVMRANCNMCVFTHFDKTVRSTF